MDDDDSSSDVQAIEDDNSDEGKPIMALFKRLIGNDNKQNTVLTNSQIMTILYKEFNIDTRTFHELEVDIYLSVMKKFLKDWPQWDEFDNIVHSLIKENNREKINTLLETKYQDLINYLKAMLAEARPRARDAIKYLEETKQTANSEASDVIMEVHCTRAQLNGLFYRHPYPDKNFTVFNVDVREPSKISLETPDYNSVINWFNVTFVFGCNSLFFTRFSKHELKHILVNKKLKAQSNENEKVNCYFQEKSTSFKKMTKRTLLDVIEKMRACNSGSKEEVTNFLLDVIEEDIQDLPSEIKIPGGYQKYLHPYPYVRYLYTDVPEPEASNDLTWDRYDLQLEELMRPLCRFFIGKVKPGSLEPNFSQQIKSEKIFVECRACSIIFAKVTMLEELRQHILDVHMNEPDFQCTKCHKTFSMVSLTKNRWTHECEE